MQSIIEGAGRPAVGMLSAAPWYQLSHNSLPLHLERLSKDTASSSVCLDRVSVGIPQLY